MAINFLNNGIFRGNVTISNASPALNLTDTDNASNIAFSSVGGALIVNSPSSQIYQIGATEKFRIAASTSTFTGDLSVKGNTLLGDANGDYVHVNDILHVGANGSQDTNDADLYFGEGATGNIKYGVHWNWDGAFTFTWSTRNNETDTAMMRYAVNDNTKVEWLRNFDMNSNKITELATPTVGPDAANKSYVDAAVAGLPSGSGTLNTIPLWTPDGDTLGDSIITQPNSSEVRVAGLLSVFSTVTGYGSTKIQTGGFSDSQSGINILNSTTGYGYILFGDGSGADLYRGQIAYKHGDDFMAFNTAGSQRMIISSTGNVGIGVTIPGSKLHVQGISGGGSLLLIRDTNSTLGTKLATFIQQDGTNNPNLDISSTSTGILLNTGFSTGIPGSFTLQSNGGGSYLAFNTNSANERMRINASGNVGIGTTSPNYALDIEKDISSLLNLHRPNSSTAAASFLDFSFNTANATEAVYARIRSDVEVNTNSAQGGDLSFHTANAGTVGEVMRLTQEGNVGIGTTSPTSNLDIFSTGTSTLTLSYNGGGGTGSTIDFSLINAAVSQPITTQIKAIDDNAFRQNLSFLTKTSATESSTLSTRMIILANGNVGIGTTSNTTHKLIVSGGSNIASFRSEGTGQNLKKLSISTGGDRVVLDASTITDTTAAFAFQTGGVERMRILDLGGIKFNAYDSTNNTGTPTYILGTDASGNVVKVLGGDIPGVSGQFVPLSGGSGVGQAMTGELHVNSNTYSQTYRSSRTDGEIYIQATTANDFVSIGTLVANNLMRIQGNGNVGIGTTSPGTKLHVSLVGGSAQLTLERTGGGAGKAVLAGAGEGLIVFDDAFGAKMYVGTAGTYNGNVGIGTISPARKLDVAGDLGIASSVNALRIGGNGVLGVLNGLTRLSGTGGASGGIMFTPNNDNTEKMRITSAGNVGIGTTNPSRLFTVAKGDTATNFGSHTGPVIAISQTNTTVNNQATLIFQSAGGAVTEITTKITNHGSNYGDLLFGTRSASGYTAKMEIASAGAIRFNTYGAGYLKADASGNITAAGASQVGPFLPLDGGTMTGDLKLNDNVVAKFGTGDDLRIQHASGGTSFIQNYTGDLSIQQRAAGKDVVFSADDGAGGIATYFTVDGGDQIVKYNKNIKLQDDVRLNLGSNNDLIIYHDPSNGSVIDSAGPGDLFIDSAQAIRFGKSGSSEVLALMTVDGSVELYDDNSKKFETTSTGVAVTGLATATTATVSTDNNATLTTKGYVDGLVTGVPVYRGTWDARNNTERGSGSDGGDPDLRLAANKILGNYYIVETAGSATPNGAGTEPNSWNVGDWCIFSDVTSGAGTDLWQRIDNSSVVSGAGTGQSVTKWEGTLGAASETLTDGPITFSTNDSTFAGDIFVTENVGHVGDTDTKMQFGTNDLKLKAGGATHFHAASNQETILYSGNAITLTLDTSQDATFTGNVTVKSGNKLILNRPNNAVVTEISTDVNGTMILNSVNNEGFKLQNNGTDLLEIGNLSSNAIFAAGATFADKVNIGTTVSTALLNIAASNSSNVKVTRIGGDTTTVYQYGTQADAVLEWTTGSYYNAEVVITASQTNGGTDANLYIRGIWSNNHTTHHWRELENVGSLPGSTLTITNGQNGSTTNSGRLTLTFDYTNGSFATLNVRITDFFGTHSYTIT